MNPPHHNSPHPQRLDTLVDPIMTVDAAHEFLQRIEQTLELLYQTKGSSIQKLKDTLSYDEYRHLKAYSKAHNLDLNDADAVQQILRALKEYTTSLPKLKLALAYAPRQAFVEEIADWLTAHAPTPLLLELTVDPEVIGGAVVSFQSKQYDFSLNRKLDEYLSQNKMTNDETPHA